MRGRQVFFETLLNHGVDRIFGNPGTTESPLLDSLLDYPQLQYIVHLHEGVAVGAAIAARSWPSTGSRSRMRVSCWPAVTTMGELFLSAL